MAKLAGVGIARQSIEEITKRRNSKNIVQDMWTAVSDLQYKIIALYKNYTHLYTVLLKKLGREIVIWYIYAGTCIYKFYETKRRNIMEQELLVAIPEAVANLTKPEKCGII